MMPLTAPQIINAVVGSHREVKNIHKLAFL